MLTIPLPDFLRLNLPAVMVRVCSTGAALIDGERNNAALNRLQFQRWHHYLRTGSHDCARIVLLEVEACLGGWPAAQAANPAPASTGDTGGFNHVQTMVAFISDHYRDSLSVDTIAQTAGLHPTTPCEQLSQTRGHDLVEYLTSTASPTPIAPPAHQRRTGDRGRWPAASNSLSRFTPRSRRSCTANRRRPIASPSPVAAIWPSSSWWSADDAPPRHARPQRHATPTEMSQPMSDRFTFPAARPSSGPRQPRRSRTSSTVSRQRNWNSTASCFCAMDTWWRRAGGRPTRRTASTCSTR
ncbi:MAG: hypothetical protein R3A10_05415 [Caldilineaceae bacterium]